MTAVELYQELEKKYTVSTRYKVGFDQELSQDVKDIIRHLKGDLFAEDIVPNGPTSILIKAVGQDIDHIFKQDSGNYMSAFDLLAFREFCKDLLPELF